MCLMLSKIPNWFIVVAEHLKFQNHLFDMYMISV